MLSNHQKGELPVKDIKVPELAESIMEGTIAKWMIKEGDIVEKGDPILELETDKVNVEVHSEYSGAITELLRAAGDDVVVGDIIGKLDENTTTKADPVAEEKVVKEEKQEESAKDSPAPGKNLEPVLAPSVRKRAREEGVDLSELTASDRLGRPQTVGATKQEAKQEEETDKSAPTIDLDKPVERVKMSRRRLTIAKRLVEAQHTAAMLTTFNEVDMTGIMNLRKERKDSFFKKNGVKLGFMSFFTKAVVGALKEFPLLNAEIEGNELLLKQFYDIGIAVSAEDGLVVPVIRHADRLDFAGIEQEIGNLATKARENKLKLDDLQGGTFTITNGGIFGSMLSTPILNTPEVGILGMHNIQKRAMVMPDDSIEVRPMMYLALSYDHRVVDGKGAVQFLVRIKELLEDPFDLLLEG